jgi:hypothetical protein
MALIPVNQLNDIRAAIKTVTDQFMDSPVTYLKVLGSVDRFQEDRPRSTTTYNLKGLAEYEPTKSSKTPVGKEDSSEVKVTFNLEDLTTAGLIDANYSPRMEQDKDTFTVHGVSYRVTAVYTDGPLTNKPVLVVIHGERIEKIS